MSIQSVFLSSTNADLATYRNAVMAAIQASDHLKCIDYRHWGPRPLSADNLCREKVLEAKLFVGLIGPYRGWEVTGDNLCRSITELEYDWAVEVGRPVFLCVTPNEFPVPAGIRECDEVHARQQAFRHRVMANGVNVVSQDFSSPDRLASSVINSLLGYLLAEEMRKSARNLDAMLVRDDRSGVREALRQLAEDHEADLDVMLGDPGKVDGEVLEARLQDRAMACLQAHQQARKMAAKYYRHIGALAFLRNTEKALVAYREATGLDTDNADGWRQLGVLHIRKGDFAEARVALEKAIELAHRGGDLALEARASGNLGAIDYYQGRYPDAERLFALDYRISRESQNSAGIARASGNLGLIYQKLKRFSEAAIMHSEAIEIARQLGDQAELARQTGNLAEVKHAQGDTAGAVEMHERALTIDEAINNREGMARHAGNLGELYFEMGDVQRSCSLLERALAIDTELKNRSGQARHAMNLGRLHSGAHDYASAVRQFIRAMTLLETLQNWADAGRCSAELAEAYAALNGPEMAASHFEKALRLLPSDLDPGARASWSNRLEQLRSGG